MQRKYIWLINLPIWLGNLILSHSHHPSVSTLKEITRIPGNPDCFRVISGKWKNPGNSGKSKFLENLQKHVENITFMVWKSIFFYRSLASLARKLARKGQFLKFQVMTLNSRKFGTQQCYWHNYISIYITTNMVPFACNFQDNWWEYWGIEEDTINLCAVFESVGSLLFCGVKLTVIIWINLFLYTP